MDGVYCYRNSTEWDNQLNICWAGVGVSTLRCNRIECGSVCVRLMLMGG